MPRRKDALGTGGPGLRRLFTLGEAADARLRELGARAGVSDSEVVRRLILALPEIVATVLGLDDDKKP